LAPGGAVSSEFETLCARRGKNRNPQDRRVGGPQKHIHTSGVDKALADHEVWGVPWVGEGPQTYRI